MTELPEFIGKFARGLELNIVKTTETTKRVLGNEWIKILGDFMVQTDRHFLHNMPDITVIAKEECLVH